MNKRTMKKGLAIVLALVMVFSMSAVAFAGTNETITVTVEFIDAQYGTVYEVVEDIEFNTATFNRAAHNPTYDPIGKPGTAVITDNTPTVLDATFKALGMLNQTQGDIVYGWDDAQTDPRGGAYITEMLGLQTETALDTSETVWRGNTWNYEIGYVDADLYASNVALEDGMVISWWYEYCEEAM